MTTATPCRCPPTRRRVTLGAHARHQRYLVTTEPDGTVILTPAVFLSEAEARFVRNEDLVRKVKADLADPGPRLNDAGSSERAVPEVWLDDENDDRLRALEDDPDPDRRKLADRVNEALLRIGRNPGDASVRRHRFQLVDAWAVTVPGPDEDWSSSGPRTTPSPT